MHTEEDAVGHCWDTYCRQGPSIGDACCKIHPNNVHVVACEDPFVGDGAGDCMAAAVACIRLGLPDHTLPIREDEEGIVKEVLGKEDNNFPGDSSDEEVHHEMGVRNKEVVETDRNFLLAVVEEGAWDVAGSCGIHYFHDVLRVVASLDDVRVASYY